MLTDTKRLAQCLPHSKNSVDVGCYPHYSLRSPPFSTGFHSFFSKDMKGACPPTAALTSAPPPPLPGLAPWRRSRGKSPVRCGGRGACAGWAGWRRREEELPEVGGGGGGRAGRSCQGNRGGKCGGRTSAPGSGVRPARLRPRARSA